MNDLEVSLGYTIGSFRLSLGFKTSARLLAVSGPSGAGKTTLINMIAGLIRPDTGVIRINGRKLFDSKNNINIPVYKRKIGYVFQDGRLFSHLNVRNNILYGKLFNRQKSDIEFDNIINILGLESLLLRGTTQLSGGERQRVAIGRALLSAPELLLMDEPLASLDQARKDDILPYIERLRDDIKVPIVYVSHNLQEIERLADEILSIKDGMIESIKTNNLKI